MRPSEQDEGNSSDPSTARYNSGRQRIAAIDLSYDDTTDADPADEFHQSRDRRINFGRRSPRRPSRVR